MGKGVPGTTTDRTSEIKILEKSFKKSYESGELDEVIKVNAVKYFIEKPNGNKFPGIIINFIKSGLYSDSGVVPFLVSRVSSKKIDENGQFQVDFSSHDEYKDFLHILAKIVINSSKNDNSLSSLLDYENFSRFILKHFPDVFGILDINRKDLNGKLNPDVQLAVSGVEGSVGGILKK